MFFVLCCQVAQRDLHLECGENMDTWIVARNPIGVYEPYAPVPTVKGPQRVSFFIFEIPLYNNTRSLILS
jgi:hypothetical protein